MELDVGVPDSERAGEVQGNSPAEADDSKFSKSLLSGYFGLRYALPGLQREAVKSQPQDSCRMETFAA